MNNELIKSKHRVDQFGEVYTPENIVNEMLDLVKDESYKIESTFLEPSCGNGNFLVKILERKLETASKLDMQVYARYVFVSVTSIYAIDIIKDNIRQAKDRLLEVIRREYSIKMGTVVPESLLRSLKFILDTNIIWGDSIAGIRQDNGQGIVIAEWKLAGDTVYRKDYSFISLCNRLGCVVEQEYEPINFNEVYNIKKKKSSDKLFEEFGF